MEAQSDIGVIEEIIMWLRGVMGEQLARECCRWQRSSLSIDS